MLAMALLCLVYSFSGPEAETQLRPSCNLRRVMFKGVVVQGLVILLLARHLGLSALVTLSTWPIVSAFLMPI